MKIDTLTKPGTRVRVRCVHTQRMVEGTVNSVEPSSTPGCWRAVIQPDDPQHPIQPVTVTWRGFSGVECEDPQN